MGSPVFLRIGPIKAGVYLERIFGLNCALNMVEATVRYDPIEERNIMESLVCEFKWRDLPHFRSLIDELDVRALRTSYSRDWHRRFRKASRALEEVYAVMLDRNKKYPDREDQETVDSALASLRKLFSSSNVFANCLVWLLPADKGAFKEWPPFSCPHNWFESPLAV